MTTVAIADEPLENPHRFTSDAHHRLYLGRDGKPTPICVQDFDYRDYDDERFLTTDAYDTELNANIALNRLLVERMRAEDFAPEEASRLAAAGMPLTRQQALDAVLSAGRP